MAETMTDRIMSAADEYAHKEGQRRAAVAGGWESGIDDTAMQRATLAILVAEACAPVFSGVLDEKVCQWVASSVSAGLWRTGCGDGWYFDRGNLADSRILYCPLCGGLVEEAEEPKR